MITIILVFIYLVLYTLSSIGIYESIGLFSFEILRNAGPFFISLNFIFCFYIFIKNKHYKNKFLFSLICISLIGMFINLVNSFSLESTPFYFSIISISSFSLGLKYADSDGAEKFHKGILFFGILNIFVAITQLYVGLGLMGTEYLLYGVGLGPGDAPWAYLSRPTGLFSNPFSLAVFGAVLIALPVKKYTYIYRIVGTFIVFISASRAYIALTFCHLVFWIISYISNIFIKKSSSILISISIFVSQILIGIDYLQKTPSTSFLYKFNTFPVIIEIFAKNPLSLFFGFTLANQEEFLSNLDPNIRYIGESYESWFLRLIIFGGLFLALSYLYPLFKIHFQSLRIKNNNLIFCTSSLIFTSLGSILSNGGFGGPISWIYFYLIAIIYKKNNLKIEKMYNAENQDNLYLIDK